MGGITTWAVLAGGSEESPRGGSAPPSHCRTQVREPSSTVAPGTRAPTFVLPGLDGTCIRTARLRGGPVVVNFWASWCNPCRREFPLLRSALERHRADHLRVVGVTYRDIPSDSRRFARQQHADWLLAVDENGDVARAYGVRPIPQTVFVRADGIVSARIYGPLSRHELDTELGKLVPRSR